MKIAYLADPGSSNAFYRGIWPMAALARCRGHQVRQLPTESAKPPVERVRDVDLLHVHRYSEEWTQVLVRAAKEAGAAVVWDNDDDLGAMPKSVVTHKHFSGFAWQRRLDGLRRIFRDADLVTAPSAVLAERFQALGAKRTATIENAIPDQLLNSPSRSHAGLTVGWVAGREHVMDVRELPIEALLQRLLDTREDVSVCTIGIKLDLRSERYRWVESVPLLSLTEHVATFDVAIAPLADLAFNRARSNVKLKEYAAAGVPWLASPIGPYAGMGERQGGRLVADDRWLEEIGGVLDRPRQRRKLAKRAAKWASGETLTKHVGVWEACFAEAVGHARAAA